MGVIGEEEVAWYPDGHALHVFEQRCGVIRHWGPAGGRIFGIVAGDGLEDNGGVFDSPGHGATVVQRPAQRYHAIAADPPVRRFEPHDTAVGGRPPDRTTRTGPQGAHAEAGRNGRPRAAARSARDMVEVPGI